jgi:hypothetical protein
MADKKKNRGEAAASESEERLDREEETLIGDTAEDRNLTGSTTYVTLPDQSSQQSQKSQQSDKSRDNGSRHARGEQRS